LHFTRLVHRTGRFAFSFTHHRQSSIIVATSTRDDDHVRALISRITLSKTSAQIERPPGNWATFPSRENSSNGG
jgi:hypothetical protein